MKFCLESFLQERWKQFPSATESLSTPDEKKTLGKYSKCGKGGISDADIPACSSCLPRAARPACCFSSSQFSFVLFSACCSSPCRSLFLWDCCYLSFTLCLDSRDCFPQPPLFAFAIIQLCLVPSVVISSGLSSSFPAEGRSMLGLVINSPRSFSGHLFKNWSLALCAGRKIMRQHVGFFFSLKTFGHKYKGVIFIIIIVVVILLQKYSSSQALSWCWWEWKEQNTQVCKMTWKPKFPAVKSLIVSSLPSWDKDHVEFIAKDPRSKGAEIKQSPQVTSELFVSTDSFEREAAHGCWNFHGSGSFQLQLLCSYGTALPDNSSMDWHPSPAAAPFQTHCWLSRVCFPLSGLTETPNKLNYFSQSHNFLLEVNSAIPALWEIVILMDLALIKGTFPLWWELCPWLAQQFSSCQPWSSKHTSSCLGCFGFPPSACSMDINWQENIVNRFYMSGRKTIYNEWGIEGERIFLLRSTVNFALPASGLLWAPSERCHKMPLASKPHAVSYHWEIK